MGDLNPRDAPLDVGKNPGISRKLTPLRVRVPPYDTPCVLTASTWQMPTDGTKKPLLSNFREGLLLRLGAAPRNSIPLGVPVSAVVNAVGELFQ